MPFDRDCYPENWLEIRARILARDGHRCTQCGVKNYSVGYRERGQFVCYSERATSFAEAKAIRDDLDCQEERVHRVLIIVLAIAHLNHDPLDCREDNLAARCQLHHLQLDRYLHSLHARATWQRKRSAEQGEQSDATEILV